ncbi:MAG: hypothetical protein IJL43_00855 [Lachnospiraceae bacterium]|nr:hypothetical protein [Lachnospiraceae bacterium]
MSKGVVFAENGGFANVRMAGTQSVKPCGASSPPKDQKASACARFFDVHAGTRSVKPCGASFRLSAPGFRDFSPADDSVFLEVQKILPLFLLKYALYR